MTQAQRCIMVWAAVAVMGLFAGVADAAVVYVMSSGEGALDTQLETLLESHGHVADIGDGYRDFDGSEDLAGYDVVLLQDSAQWGTDMDVPGQQKLVDFVSAGGGLVTGEWVMWEVGVGRLVTLEPCLPTLCTGAWNSASPITYTQVEPELTVNAGVSSPFTFTADYYAGTESDIWAKPGAHTFYSSSNLTDGVAGWDYLAGRAISFSTVLGPDELAHPDYGRLVSNAVYWAAHQRVPEPATVALLLTGAAALFRRRRTRR